MADSLFRQENLVFTSRGTLKLVDMGLATQPPPGRRCFTRVGTPEYLAPEVYDGSGYDGAADWWAVGCLVYEMYHAHTPWLLDGDGVVDDATTDEAISRRVLAHCPGAAVPHPRAQTPPPPALDLLLNRLLERRPSERGGASDTGGTAAVCAHLYFASVD